jgi:hypothetical protein
VRPIRIANTSASATKKKRVRTKKQEKTEKMREDDASGKERAAEEREETPKKAEKKEETPKKEQEKEREDAPHGYNINFKNSWGKAWKPPDGTFTITPDNYLGFQCFDRKHNAGSSVGFISMCMIDRRMEPRIVHHYHEVKRHTEYNGSGYFHPDTGIFIYHGRGDFSSYQDEAHRKILDHYQGAFEHGFFHGRGYYRSNVSTYEGEFYYGCYHGKGMIQYHDQQQIQYKGDFKYNIRDGKGILDYEDIIYTGDFVNDAITGMGQAIYLYSNQIYTGEFRDGVPVEGDEDGVITFLDEPNRSIVGKFNGSLDCDGIYTYTAQNGNVHRGGYIRDQKHGGGRIQFTNGDVFEGIFHQGNARGRGTYTTTKGDIYSGDFEGFIDIDCTSKFSKYGVKPIKVELYTITYANGDKYTGKFVGDFIIDCKKQRITLTLKSGAGTVKHSNGEEETGVFEDNNFVSDVVREEETFTKVGKKGSKSSGQGPKGGGLSRPIHKRTVKRRR